MPEWISDLFEGVTVAQLLTWIALFIVIGTFIAKGWPTLKLIVKLVDAIPLLLKLSTFIKEVQEQIDNIQKQVQDIHHETHRNDGSSIKDATIRIEEGVKGLYTRQDQTDKLIEELQYADRQHQRAIDELTHPSHPTLEIPLPDEEGENK